MTDTNFMQQKKAWLQAQRKAILADTEKATREVQENQRYLAKASAERERLQEICKSMLSHGDGEPPLKKFAMAVLEVEKVANRLIAAEKREAEAIAEQKDKLSQLEAEDDLPV